MENVNKIVQFINKNGGLKSGNELDITFKRTKTTDRIIDQLEDLIRDYDDDAYEKLRKVLRKLYKKGKVDKEFFVNSDEIDWLLLTGKLNYFIAGIQKEDPYKVLDEVKKSMNEGTIYFGDSLMRILYFHLMAIIKRDKLKKVVLLQLLE